MWVGASSTGLAKQAFSPVCTEGALPQTTTPLIRFHWTCRHSSLRLHAFKEHEGRGLGADQAAKEHPYYKLRENPSPVMRLQPPSEISRGSVVAMVLGGGPNDYTKLFPLTENRALPAIPCGGVYRLIDIPISNLINSGINKMYIITQFNSQSLNRHLTKTYSLPGIATGHGGFIEVLSVSQSPGKQHWSEGTADSVRQFLWIIDDVRNRRDVSDVIILPADQLYRTDFSWAEAAHRVHDADITILCQPVSEEQTEHMGVCKVEGVDTGLLSDGGEKVWWVKKFVEKPVGEAKKGMRLTQQELKQFKQTSVTAAAAVSGDPRVVKKSIEAGEQKHLQPDVDKRPFLGSTGIYIFRRSTLVELLEKKPDLYDFGSDVLPWAVENGLAVQALQIEGFWRDIGSSIKDFYQASMDMTHASVFDITENCGTEEQRNISSSAPFFDPIAFKQLVYQAPLALPPQRYMGRATIRTSHIAPGVTIGNGARIEGSIVGLRSVIGENVEITSSVIMGSDNYEREKMNDVRKVGPTFPTMGVGDDSIIRGAILDKNARVGKNVQLVNASGLYNSQDFASAGVNIRDGIMVVTKGAVIVDGTII